MTATFHGNPCRVCGRRLRYSSYRACVRCAKERAKAHFERRYYGTGIDSFIYRSKRQLNNRRAKALQRAERRSSGAV